MAHKRFEWAVTRARSGPDPDFDVDLYQFPTVGVVPSKGSLAPGWLLLIPRTEVTSICQLDRLARSRLDDVRARVAGDLLQFDRDIFWFEHGAARIGSLVGCGVDQAHLHLVPLSFDLIEASLRAEPVFCWQQLDPADPWTGIQGGQDYLLISNGKVALVAYPPIAVSQFFRKIIASELHCGAEWDYRRYAHVDTARETVRRLAFARAAA